MFMFYKRITNFVFTGIFVFVMVFSNFAILPTNVFADEVCTNWPDEVSPLDQVVENTDNSVADTSTSEETLMPPNISVSEQEPVTETDNEDDSIVIEEVQLEEVVVNNENEYEFIKTASESSSNSFNSSCSLTLYSDTSDMVQGGSNAVATYNSNPRWTASIPGATWVWKTFFVENPVTGESATFEKTFNITNTIISPELIVAADNSYKVFINDVVVGGGSEETNYFNENKDIYNTTSYLSVGENKITFEVKNWPQTNGTPEHNPAGLLYKMVVNRECGTLPINTPPLITLIGSNPLFLTVDDLFVDPSATATDTQDGDLTSSIVKTGTIDTSIVSTTTLTYSVTDSGGLSASTTRTVIVKPKTDNTGGGGNGSTNTPPTITLIGNNPFNIFIGDTFTDPGATSTDAQDGDLTSSIVVSGSVSTSTLGTTTLTYSVYDSGGLGATTTRQVVVLATSTATTTPQVVPPTNPPTDNGGGGSNGGGGGGGSSSLGGRRHDINNIVSSGGGEILGASSCFYLRDFLKIDWKNDPIEVLKLQSFLNVFEKENLSLTGVYNQATFEAVERFQIKYNDDILIPWGDKVTTGFVYILTKKKVNEIYCKALFPVTKAEQNEIDNFRSSGINIYGAVGQNVGGFGQSISLEDTDLEIGGVPVVDLVSSSSNKSVVRNLAISLFALPQKIFGDWKYFLAFILLVIIIIAITRLLRDSHDGHDDTSGGPMPISETSIPETPIQDEKSPVIILPGVLPDEEIIIENPEEGPEEITPAEEETVPTGQTADKQETN